MLEGKRGSAQIAAVSDPQARRCWASTCPHPNTCRNKPQPLVRLSRAATRLRDRPLDPASPPGAGPTKGPSPPQNLPQGSPSIATRPLRALDLEERKLPGGASPNSHERPACPPAAPSPEDTAGPPAASVHSQGRLLPEQNLTPRGRQEVPPPTLPGAQVPTPPRPPSQRDTTRPEQSPQAQTTHAGQQGADSDGTVSAETTGMPWDRPTSKAPSGQD